MQSHLPRIERPGHIRVAQDVELFYRDWGTGKPVLFVSSWVLNSDAWAYQMRALSQAGLRCIAYDRRGHGRSSDPGGGYDFDTLADDLAAVIEALDLEDVTLVSHSMGVGEIIRYLSRHGSRRIARIVPVAGTAPLLIRRVDNPDGIDPAVFEQVHRDLADDFPMWLEANIDAFFGEFVSQPMREWVRGLALTTSLKALLDCNYIVPREDFRAELARIEVPALFIHGSEEQGNPVEITSAAAVRLMPNARLKVYEGAPHGLIFTHRDRLNADLLDFIQGRPA